MVVPATAMAWLPSLLAMLGGACMGTYPVFVKTPAMRAAKVHPFIFQGYKSVWVLIVGGVLVLARFASGAEPVYVFTPWGVASACAWVPAGMSLIAAIPKIGVGTAVLIFDSTTTLVSFFVFWLVFQEPIKTHELPGGGVYYLAPVYMVGACLGMAGLIILPAKCSGANPKLAEPLLGTSALAAPAPSAAQQAAAGYALAAVAGVLSATQYGLVTIGKQVATASGVPPEALDPLGSWTASFGVGAVAVNALALGALCSAPNPPAPQTAVTLLPGSAAGLLYCAALVLTTLAVQLGGNAVITAQRNAITLIVSGAWGVLWYKEIRGRALVGWAASALFTVTMTLALGFEKLPEQHH